MQKGYYPFFTFSEKRVKEIINPEISIISSPSLSDHGSKGSHWAEDDGFIVLEYEEAPT